MALASVAELAAAAVSCLMRARAAAAG
jgi:hypothetical protein